MARPERAAAAVVLAVDRAALRVMKPLDGCSGAGLLTMLVVFEAVLFGLFTLCMLFDQVVLQEIRWVAPHFRHVHFCLTPNSNSLVDA
jgi:hypothetical protein